MEVEEKNESPSQSFTPSAVNTTQEEREDLIPDQSLGGQTDFSPFKKRPPTPSSSPLPPIPPYFAFQSPAERNQTTDLT